LALIIRIYHEARSSECQISTSLFVIFISTCLDSKRSSSDYDDALGSKRVTIHTTVEVVLTVLTPLIIRKHNGMSNFKGNFYPQVNNNNVCDIAIVNLVAGTLYVAGWKRCTSSVCV